MKKIIILLFIVISVSCAMKEKKKYLPEDYSGWKKTTDTKLNYPVSGHENHFRIPYINETGENPEITTDNDREIYSYRKGTIIIKEIYEGLSDPKPGEKPVKLVAMVKDPDDKDSQEGWIWITKVDGKETVFKSDYCITCHNDANGVNPYGDRNISGDFRDYVFFPYYIDTNE